MCEKLYGFPETINTLDNSRFHRTRDVLLNSMSSTCGYAPEPGEPVWHNLGPLPSRSSPSEGAPQARAFPLTYTMLHNQSTPCLLILPQDGQHLCIRVHPPPPPLHP